MASRRKSHLPNRIDVKKETVIEEHIDVGHSPKIVNSVDNIMTSIKYAVNGLSSFDDRIRLICDLQQQMEEMKNEFTVFPLLGFFGKFFKIHCFFAEL